MNCLVIGYGSIGERHHRILKEMGHDVSVVSLRHLSGVKLFYSVDDAISSEQRDYVVIAN